MYKPELIAIHALLEQLSRYFEAEEVTTAHTSEGVFAEYKQNHVSAIEIHQSKADHTAAICTLGETLSTLAAEAGTEPREVDTLKGHPNQ